MNIKSLQKQEIVELFKALGQPKYRADQVFDWILKGARGFDEMTNLPLALREKLKAEYSFDNLTIQNKQISKDGTRKYLLGLIDGECVESVFMKYEYGNSVCLSTQVGCNMGCKFCASTLGGKKRDLKAWEILDEYLTVRRETGEDISHVVLMGIGEPFDNYEEISIFLNTIHELISFRNITVSTCGIIPKIEEFGKDFPQVNLAVSLHAATQDARAKIMPIAKRYKLDDLIKACKAHEEKTGRRVTYEYTLIAGQNDSPEDAKALAKLLKGQLAHVNLIPLNPVAETGLLSSGKEAAISFSKSLEKLGISSTVRRSLGADIDAACGQLRKKSL